MSSDHSRRATVTDVARLARVDRAVVSKLLNDDPHLRIRPDTRERVLQAVATLNYRPNAMARSLRTARSGTYGLLIPDFANPIYAAIINGAQAAARERDYLLLTGSTVDSDHDRYLDLLGNGRLDAILLAGGRQEGALVDRVASLDLPWLMLNRRVRGSSRNIVLDDAAATTMAVRHLVQLGHRRIAHLAGPVSADTATRRAAGFRAEMKRAGLPLTRAGMVRADYTNLGGHQAMEKLLAVSPRPTAVVVANVASAIGALHAVRRNGLRVPRDVSIVAVHDMALAGYLDPPLTTVKMPLEALGRRGVEVLATHAPDVTVEEVISQPMELIVRESTAEPG